MALHDPRTPKDVRKALTTHLRDVLRGDNLLYEGRPLSLPQSDVRISPEVRRAFRDLYKALLRLCRTSTSVTSEDVVELLQLHLPEGRPEIDASQREAVEGVLRTGMKPHLKAKMVLAEVFGISERYTRKLTYGW
jgi:hypothetical protein